MNKERELYDRFVNTLLDKLDNPDVTEKELKIILDFLDNNNIQAREDVHPGLKRLKEEYDLPFDIEEMPQV